MENERTPRVLLPGYMPGDTISVGPFSFRHEMKVSYVTANFALEHGDHEIVLTGDPEPEGPPQGIQTASGPRRIMYGKVLLEGVVEGTDPAGEYRCVGLTAHSAGENEVAFKERPDLRFIVMLEPSRPPHIAGTISLGQQEFHYHGGVYDQDRDEFIRPVYDYDQGKFANPE